MYCIVARFSLLKQFTDYMPIDNYIIFIQFIVGGEGGGVQSADGGPIWQIHRKVELPLT